MTASQWPLWSELKGAIRRLLLAGPRPSSPAVATLLGNLNFSR